MGFRRSPGSAQSAGFRFTWNRGELVVAVLAAANQTDRPVKGHPCARGAGAEDERGQGTDQDGVPTTTSLRTPSSRGVIRPRGRPALGRR
jgi:hypothetical protein